MKNKFRVLGFVTCLLVVWMVTRGSNGCMVETKTGTLELSGTLDNYGDAAVYGSGKAGVNVKLKNLKPDGTGTIDIHWYYPFQGEEGKPYEGVLTIICKDGRHTHVEFSVMDGGAQPIPLPKPVGLSK